MSIEPLTWTALGFAAGSAVLVLWYLLRRPLLTRSTKIVLLFGVGLLPIDNLVGRADAVVGSWDLGKRSQPVWTWLSGFRLARFFTAVH